MTTLLLIEDNMPLRENLSEMLTLDGYSPREVEVLLWVAQGKGNHEIAAILELSVASSVSKAAQ